jgi:hypothetical protein
LPISMKFLPNSPKTTKQSSKAFCSGCHEAGASAQQK